MIAYLFLGLGAAGAAGVIYYLAPAGRGLHRYVVPRSVLRAEAVTSTAAADELACKLVGLASEHDAVCGQRDDLVAALEKAGIRIADLEDQLRAFDMTCAENSRLRSELANATAMRSALPGLSPADDASALPDALQEFADQTTTAWRTRA
ncbi:hypothetical protein [Streptomyces chartreusis]|uniref:hypothetical protein n=1 Tax=Streptomyces chartreusis TaxID=1969 RepID=UPI0038222F6F